MDTHGSYIIRLLLLGVISSTLLLDSAQSSDKGKFVHHQMFSWNIFFIGVTLTTSGIWYTIDSKTGTILLRAVVCSLTFFPFIPCALITFSTLNDNKFSF